MSPPAPCTEGTLLSSCGDSLSSHNSHGRGPLGSAPDSYLDLWYRLCLQWARMDASIYGTKQLRNNHALPLHCKQSLTLLIMAIVQWHCSPWELVGVHIETEVFKSDHATCRLQYRCILKPWCQVEKSGTKATYCMILVTPNLQNWLILETKCRSVATWGQRRWEWILIA